jgi:hypothetical protein
MQVHDRGERTVAGRTEEVPFYRCGLGGYQRLALLARQLPGQVAKEKPCAWKPHDDICRKTARRRA